MRFLAKVSLLAWCVEPALLCLATAGQPPVRESFDELMQIIRRGNAYQRAENLHRLAQADDARVLPELIRLLHDEDDRVRANAAYQLGNLADPRGTDALAEVLNDPYENVRLYAARGLAKTGSGRHVPALVNVLSRTVPPLGPGDVPIRSILAMLEAIGALSPTAPPHVIGLLDRISPDHNIDNDYHWRVLEAAAQCLGRIADKAASPALVRADEVLSQYYHDYGTWHAVRKALAAIVPENFTFDRPAADILITIRPFKMTGEAIRLQWVRPLVQLGPEAIGDLDWTLRFNDTRGWSNERITVAIKALGEIGGPDAARVLRRQIDHLARRLKAESSGAHAYRYRLQKALLALLEALPREETIDDVLGTFPQLDGFQQSYLLHDVSQAPADGIPGRLKVLLYQRILNDPNPGVSTKYAVGKAAALLAETGGPLAGRTLSQALLESDNVRVTEATATALGTIGDYDVVPALTQAADREDAPIGPIAIAMAKRNDPRLILALQQLQNDARTTEPARYWIAAALARLGQDYTRNAALVRNALPRTLEQAAWLNDAQTIDTLADLARAHTESTGERAIETLEAIGTPESLAALMLLADAETAPLWLQRLSATTARLATTLGHPAREHYETVAAVVKAVRHWFIISQAAVPAPTEQESYRIAEQHPQLAGRIWIAEATRRLDLAAGGQAEPWEYDIPDVALHAVGPIFGPELLPALERIAAESTATVDFHGKYALVRFYHLRSLAAGMLTDKAERPCRFVDFDGRTHPGGWTSADEP